MTDDLELIETEVLVAELKKRFDVLIVCGYKNVDAQNEFVGRYVKGHALQAIGLCEYMKKGIIDGYDEIAQPTSGDIREW